jgi:hypothetical protein
MTAECPPDLFKEFEKNTGGSARPEAGGQQFLYDALGDHMHFTGLTFFTIPKLDDETFGEWEKFEYWCEDIKLKLMWEIVDYESEDFQFAYEKLTPKRYFKSKSVVKEKIIAVLTDGSSDHVENIMCVEIECNSKKLFLIYFDSDSWALGHGDSVLVVKSLAQLHKKDGFYPLS